MKELSFWLNANKVALNVAKTEVILSKTKHKPCDTDLRLKLCRKRLYKTKYLRYLGIKIDENLNWKIHIHDLASKFNRTNAVLAKLKHFVNFKLRSTYFAIFQVITHSDLGENWLSIQPLLHGIILKRSYLTEYNCVHVFNTKKPTNIISTIFHFWV